MAYLGGESGSKWPDTFQGGMMLARQIVCVAAFVALELVGVGYFGKLAARKSGLGESSLIPLSFLVYSAAGFTASRLGGSAFVAGGSVAAIDAGVWALFSREFSEEVPSRLWLPIVSLVPAVFGLMLGGILGALGGWIAKAF